MTPAPAKTVYNMSINITRWASSRRPSALKHDIQADGQSQRIASCGARAGATFKYNSDKTGRTQYGLIAEEVAKVAPDLVVREQQR